MHSDAERAARLAAIRAVLEVAAGKRVDADAIFRIAREAVAEIFGPEPRREGRHLRPVSDRRDRGGQ
ncbi:MAG TPA: hypothetical protein VGV40_09475 [Solirubrobacteraceae bacterium]|nr:hypothetical protein [Solirubrobacteraceae bacterium]